MAGPGSESPHAMQGSPRYCGLLRKSISKVAGSADAIVVE